MNKTALVILTSVVLIVLGFIIAIILPESAKCTLLACPCENVVGERPCNFCAVYDPIFMIGIINFAKICSAQEMITCENDVNIDRRIDIDKSKCKYTWQVFGIPR